MSMCLIFTLNVLVLNILLQFDGVQEEMFRGKQKTLRSGEKGARRRNAYIVTVKHIQQH